MLRPNATSFQPGRQSPRGPFGEQGSSTSNADGMYGSDGRQLLPASSPAFVALSSPISGMVRGQRSQAPMGLSLNVSAPAFQYAVASGGSVGGASPGAPHHSHPVSPFAGGGLSPASSDSRQAMPPYFALSPGGSNVSDANSLLSPGFPQPSTPGSAGWGATSNANGSRQARRGRGLLPVNQPVRTTGHNSKPSVSLNPAAFASALAVPKPRRKVAVRMPTEIALGGDSSVQGIDDSADTHTITEEGEDEDKDREVAMLRTRWTRREPLADVDVNALGEAMPHEYVTSRPMLPDDSNDKADGLPDFVDIFLPGRGAWDEVREVLAQEREGRQASESMQTDEADSVSASQREKEWRFGAGGDGGTFGLSPEKARHVNMQTPTGHGHTMSLSIPPSGKPFGPATLTAMGLPSPLAGMERAFSGSEDHEPALGSRPNVARLASEPLRGKIPTPDSPPSATGVSTKRSSWRDLGRGFGYDVAEEDDSHTSERGSHRRRHKDDVLELRSNASGDADSSEPEEGEADTSWLDRRRRMSHMPFDATAHQARVDKGDDGNVDAQSEEEYSNPSDEEAARAERRAQLLVTRTGNRPRAGTAETIASSTLDGGQWHHGEAADVRVMSRGPLDDTAPFGVSAHGGQTSSHGQPRWSSGGTKFRPDAPAFTPSNGSRVSGGGEGDVHYRLPSIPNSSFGGSFKHSSSLSTGLNAAAPSFVPGAFTFTAPGNAPKLPQAAATEGLFEINQGRAKRIRHQADEQIASMESSIDDDGATMTARSASPQPPLSAHIDSASRGSKGVPVDATNAAPSKAGLNPAASVFPAPAQSTSLAFTLQHASVAPFQPSSSRGGGGVPVVLSTAKPITIRKPDEVDVIGISGLRLQEQQQLRQQRSGANPSAKQQVDATLSRHSFSTASADGFSMDSGELQDAQAQRKRSSLRGVAGERDRASEGDDLSGGDDDDDDGTVSDIIEELGERMDRALEGWAGKILDEVTIMGQVRPVNMVTLDANERRMLIEAVGQEVSDLLANHHERLHDRLIEISVHADRRHAIEEGGDGSMMSASDPSLVSDADTSVPYSSFASGEGKRAPRDGHLPFDLEQKLSSLQNDLHAAFDTTLPRAMEGVAKQVKDSLESSGFEDAIKRIEILPALLREMQEAGTAAAAFKDVATPNPVFSTSTSPATVELSVESSDTIASLMIGRLQPVLDEVAHQVGQYERADLAQTLEPLMEEHLAQTRARSQSDRQDLVHLLNNTLDEKRAEWDRTLAEIKDATGDQMQAMIVKNIVPHLETLRGDSNAEADVIVARVTEILVPLIQRASEGARGGEREVMTSRSLAAFDVGDLSTKLMAQMLPHIQNAGGDTSRSLFDANEMDQEVLAERIAELVAKAHPADSSRTAGDYSFDLSAVIAVLEPVVGKQDELRTLARKALEKQEEIEMSLNALPSAVNAKMEVILASSQSLQDGHSDLAKKLDEHLAVMREGVSAGRGHALGEEDADYRTQLTLLTEERDALSRAVQEARSEAATSASSLTEAVSRMESRLEAVQGEATVAKKELDEMRQARQDDTVELQSKVTELGAQLAMQHEHHTMLQAHNSQLNRELCGMRQDRANERESAAQAASEAMVRAERAEEALRTERSRTETLLDQMRAAESAAMQQSADALQRAAKAEGEVAAMERRVSEQDTRIANLQQLTATQKQKAAQSGQKAAEMEKRLRELEASDRELDVARARMIDMEARAMERDQLEARLRSSTDSEMQLREQVASYQARFLDFERDLMAMRESLVGRDELEQSQACLTAAREEIAELRGQLTARQQRDEEKERHVEQREQHLQQLGLGAGNAAEKVLMSRSSAAWAHRSPSHSSSSYASVYAPDTPPDERRSSMFGNDVTDSPPNPYANESHLSHFRSSVSSSRAVEQSVDGWWS